MQSRIVIKGILKNGIGALDISHDGKKIAATALDPDHTIAIYDIYKGYNQRLDPGNSGCEDALIATGKLTKNFIFDIKFDFKDKIIFAACLKEILFITFDHSLIKVA